MPTGGGFAAAVFSQKITTESTATETDKNTLLLQFKKSDKNTCVAARVCVAF